MSNKHKLFTATYNVPDVKELLAKADEGAEILFVHDQGVYLMIPPGSRKNGASEPFVLHCLQGRDHMAGMGDDFAEHFKASDILPEDADQYDVLVFDVYEETIEIGLMG